MNIGNIKKACAKSAYLVLTNGALEQHGVNSKIILLGLSRIFKPDESETEYISYREVDLEDYIKFKLPCFK